MQKYLLIFLIITGSCQKEENKSTDKASIKETQFNQLEISQQLDRDKIDSILVTTNIFRFHTMKFLNNQTGLNTPLKTLSKMQIEME